MIKYVFLIVFSILSASCNATSCLITDDAIAKNSIEYANVIDIKVSKNNGLLSVVLTAPIEIKGMKFKSVILHKDKLKNEPDEFAMPLNAFIENGKVMTWYNVDEKTANGNYLTIDYGEDCGISLSYRVM
ncbi:MAG: hypothetical protein HRT37_26490 [Alteromonadaceae bacterium]|nr:hypothetical protein [Alteromonadaceae bacterium]